MNRLGRSIFFTSSFSGMLGALILAGAPVSAQELKSDNPSNQGFSEERLARIDARLQTAVTQNEIAGGILMVARNGRMVYDRAFGYRDSAKKAPVTRDTAFLLASMTKTVTSVGIMILVEEGKIRLNDPVTLYLPELKKIPGVAVEVTDPVTKKTTMRIEPIRKEMLVIDLLRHTAGFSNGGEVPNSVDTSMVGAAYRAAKVGNPGRSDISNQELIRRLATVPLSAQPGTTFEYGIATDVLGSIIEVVSGTTLQSFVNARIAGPLGIKSFSFQVPPADKLFMPYDRAPGLPSPGTLRREDGATGMSATAQDFMRFAQMLANGGILDGVRILAPKTVSLMTHNHLPPGVIFSAANPPFASIAPTPEMGQGFGLGFTVRLNEGGNPAPGSPGDFYWPGGTGVNFWVDPVEHLVVVWMSLTPQLATKAAYRAMIRGLVYQALVDDPKR